MHLWILALACALLVGCGGGGGGNSAPVEPPPVVQPEPQPEAPAGCSVAEQRQSLRSAMENDYFWPTQAGDAGAATMDAYFQSLLFKPTDRYSDSESSANDVLLILGQRVGYGYTLAWADAAGTVLKVRNVEPHSPVALAGLRRGDTVLAIDGQSPAQVAAGSLAPVSTPGVPREFVLRDAAGQERRLAVSSAQFPLSTVPATATFSVTRPAPGGSETVKVGYIVYQQFMVYGYIELGDAIRSMAAAGVQELVLDLRYNNGGSVNLSRDLASMVGGTRVAGQVFAQLRYNARNVASNYDMPFITLPAGLPAPPLQGLPRVLVITSGATASASELFINGLKPLMPVVLVGQTTYGKPYGFVARESCGTSYNAVKFETFNGQGLGRYTAGFAPDCEVADDLDRQLGDPLEARTRAALDYIATGSCAALPRSLVQGATRPPQAFGETWSGGMLRD